MSPDYSVNHLPDRTAVHNIATRTVGLGLFGGMATHGVGGALTEKATTGSGGRHVINSHVNAISISGQKVAMEELDRREVFLLPSIFVTSKTLATIYRLPNLRSRLPKAKRRVARSGKRVVR